MQLVRRCNKRIGLNELISPRKQCARTQVLEFVHFPVHTRLPAAWKQGKLVNAGLCQQGSTQSSASSVLRTLVLCDLVDSTALVERLGDREAAELIRKHDRLARTLVDRHGGREIDKTDGFLMMFERPVQAVAFALDYQRGLRQLNAAEKTGLSARVGIHVGDVVVWDNSSEDIANGAKPVEVEGLVKPVTSRLMNLALPGQILLSNIAYVLAHRAQGELGEQLGMLRWRTHGRYRFRGVPDPVAVFEVGEDGFAPLKAPPWSSKAHREVPFWRRPATVVIEALAVSALILVPLVMFMRPDPAIAFASRDWVVIGSLHNLTGETLFNDSLESALRIGLEQSRYVNVMPDLKVRDTITRMQRDPDKTEIDRAVGSEVAIRDGARALILPTIAEIGGRVRITAEVVDPQTQTTVYSESADGIGKESILPSLDAINNRLRVRLGEALATVSNESKPLEKVTTKDLDALRAYAEGRQAYNAGRDAEAQLFFEQALALDPEFASARIELAKVFVVLGNRARANAELKSASELKDRISARDMLYVDAFLSTLNGASHTTAIAKWKLLTGTYPDFLSGQAMHAYYLSWYGNRNDEAADSATKSLSSRNANPANSHLLLGVLFLARDRLDEALAEFKEAGSEKFPGLGWMAASAHAAAGRLDQAEATIVSATPQSNPARGYEMAVVQAAIQIDRGNTSAALKALTLDNPQDLQALEADLALPKLAVTSLAAGGTERDKAIKAFLAGKKKAVVAAAASDLFDQQIEMLLAAYLAARSGLPDVAEAAIKDARLPSTTTDYPILDNLLGIVQAQVSLARSQPAKALEKLQPFVGGNEIYLTHAALMEAHAASQDWPHALQEARWLMNHRGKAYVEFNVKGAVCLNVAYSVMATLNAAEYAAASGDSKSAKTYLATLETRWPNMRQMHGFSDRAVTLQKTLK